MTTYYVAAGVVSSGAVVNDGDTLDILSSGTANATSVYSGGFEQVDLGGLASGTLVFSGGTEIVSGGGTDAGAAISGGKQEVSGTANGAIVYAGSQVVESGGVATDTTIFGGAEIVSTAAPIRALRSATASRMCTGLRVPRRFSASKLSKSVAWPSPPPSLAVFRSIPMAPALP